MRRLSVVLLQSGGNDQSADASDVRLQEPPCQRGRPPRSFEGFSNRVYQRPLGSVIRDPGTPPDTAGAPSDGAHPSSGVHIGGSFPDGLVEGIAAALRRSQALLEIPILYNRVVDQAAEERSGHGLVPELSLGCPTRRSLILHRPARAPGFRSSAGYRSSRIPLRSSRGGGSRRLLGSIRVRMVPIWD